MRSHDLHAVQESTILSTVEACSSQARRIGDVIQVHALVLHHRLPICSVASPPPYRLAIGKPLLSYKKLDVLAMRFRQSSNVGTLMLVMHGLAC